MLEKLKAWWEKVWLSFLYSGCMVDAYLASHREDMKAVADWKSKAEDYRRELDCLAINRRCA